MTTGEIISSALRFYLNQGKPSVTSNQELREKAYFFAVKTAKSVHNYAPWWWKLANGNTVLSSGIGTMPTNFSHFGFQGAVFVQGQRFRTVEYASPEHIAYMQQTSPQTGQPYYYTLSGKTALGVPKIQCWPADNSTLDLLNYTKKSPTLIDIPLAPVLAAISGGTLTGSYTGKVTFVHPDGETEGGFASAVATAGTPNQQFTWTNIMVSPARTVTARKLYRPAAGGLQYKLVTTIADNLATSFTPDAVIDGSLGTDIPTVSTAVTGLELFPDDFHESVIYEGIVYCLANAQGDGRDVLFKDSWIKEVRRMWAEVKQGQNVLQAMPAFPGGFEGHPVWGFRSPPG